MSKKKIVFFHNRTWQTAAEIYKTNVEEGLSEEEAAQRLHTFGRNELASEPRDPWWKIFLGQLTDLLVIMLLIAAIVSGVFEEFEQCAFIIVLVLGMAILGTYQEVRAGDSLDALSSLSAPNADVVRGGKTMTIDSTLLVPGDIILLEMGRTIPADTRLVSCQGLQSAEAALTGESVGKKKNAEFVGTDGVEFKDDKGEKQENQNICFMGCTVLEGRARGIVVKTGMNTEMGLIASLMNNADETRSPLQIQLSRLGTQLAIYSFSLSLVVWIIGVSTGRGLDPYSSQDKFLQMTLVAVALTVAAVPEALPTMVTITLAMGMNRMSQRKALLRNLHGTVTLASVSVICSDKTGTLTAGEMTATRMWVDHQTSRITGIGFKPEGFIVPEGTNLDDAGAVKGAHDANRKGMHLIASVIATLCSDVTIQDGEIKGNMSEKPLVVAMMKTGMSQQTIAKLCPRVHEIPFDSKRKMMSTLVTNGGISDYKASGDNLEEFALNSFPELRKSAAFSCVKGAPNFVLDFCTRILRQNGTTAPLSADEKKSILNKIDDFSSEALRVLAVAVRLFDKTPEDLTPENVERELVLVGMFASIDPERPEVKAAIQTAYGAGIRVVAISGDYTKTLFAIAKNIGLLQPDAPFSKVLDCEEIRPDGERAIAIEHKMAEHKKKACLTPEELKTLQEELMTINDRLDKVTNFVDCFGRAKPQDKIVILKSLQRQGHVASMTGDGVNDAPALKQANIGVAMGSGTDAAKAASSMILVDDSFSTIVAGVEEGRAIYRNISIFIFMLLSENVAEVLFVLLSICFNQPAPLGAIQLLLLNLFTDGAPAIALAVETSGNDSLMSEGPRNQHESIISPIMRVGIVIHVIILCGMCCLMYTLALIRYTGSEIGVGDHVTQKDLWAATTIAYLYIVAAELLRAYTCRSLRDSLWKIGFFSNNWMQKSVAVGFIGAVLFAVIPGLNEALGFVQLKGEDWAYILGLCWVPCICEELVKYIYRQTGFGLRPIAIRGDKRD